MQSFDHRLEAGRRRDDTQDAKVDAALRDLLDLRVEEHRALEPADADRVGRERVELGALLRRPNCLFNYLSFAVRQSVSVCLSICLFDSLFSACSFIS